MMTLQVGQKIIVHRRTSPARFIKKIWAETDIQSIDLQTIWESLELYDKLGVVKEINGKNNVLVEIAPFGMWCLESNMLDVYPDDDPDFDEEDD